MAKTSNIQPPFIIDFAMLVKAIFTLSPGITRQHKIIGIEEAVLCLHLRIADEKKCARCTLHARSLSRNFAFLHKNILGYWNKEACELFNEVQHLGHL